MTSKEYVQYLMNAQEAGDSTAIRNFIKKNCDEVDNKQDLLDFALTQVALIGDIELGKELIAQGANPLCSSNTPLRYASMKGKLDFVNYLLDNFDVNTEDFSGHAIYMAAGNGHLGVLKALLKHPSNKDKYVSSAMEKSLSGRRGDVALWLIKEKGAYVSTDNATSLLFFSKETRVPLVESFLSGHGHSLPERLRLLRGAVKNHQKFETDDIINLLTQHGVSLKLDIDGLPKDIIAFEDDFWQAKAITTFELKALVVRETIFTDNPSVFSMLYKAGMSNNLLDDCINLIALSGAIRTAEFIINERPDITQKMLGEVNHWLGANPYPEITDMLIEPNHTGIKALCEAKILKAGNLATQNANRKGL